MNNAPDRDVAMFAASIASSLNNHINANTTTNQKDIELLNPSRLDITKFLPARRGGYNIPNRGHVQGQLPNPNFNPNHNPNYNPNYQHHHPNAWQEYPQNATFEPVPLPNRPSGYLPMNEAATKLVTEGSGFEFAKPNEKTEFQKVDISAPTSFQNTNFSSPTTKSTANTPTTIIEELLQGQQAQLKELTTLKKKIGTLSTRLYKVLKLLEDKPNDVETKTTNIFQPLKEMDNE